MVCSGGMTHGIVLTSQRLPIKKPSEWFACEGIQNDRCSLFRPYR